MDVRPLDITFYQYQFQDLMAARNRRQSLQRTQTSRPLVADIVVSHNQTATPPAPQGVGEMKYTITEPAKIPVVESLEEPVKQPEPKEDSWFSDSAFKYLIGGEYFKPPLGIREEMEDEVRKRKIAKLPCPFADKNNHCSALFIRCGERIQFASPETLEQRNQPHTCLYRPQQKGKYILIIDENQAIRDFCKNSLVLFFNYESDKIITANSGHEAVQLLKKLKIEGKQCGLLICSTSLSGISGYKVVNELFDRNFNTEVILTKNEHDEIQEPKDYKGVKEIIPEKTIVKKIISKPFHSSTFINTLTDLDIKQLLD